MKDLEIYLLVFILSFLFTNNCVYFLILYLICCVLCDLYFSINKVLCICNYDYIYYIKYIFI